MANNPLRGRWDVVNKNIYNTHLKGAPVALSVFHAEVGNILHQLATRAPVPDRSHPGLVHSLTWDPPLVCSMHSFFLPQACLSATLSSKHCNYNYQQCRYPQCKRIHRCPTPNHVIPMSTLTRYALSSLPESSFPSPSSAVTHINVLVFDSLLEGFSTETNVDLGLQCHYK